MLNNVAIAVNRANRQRTLREPNRIDCVLFTKRVERGTAPAEHDDLEDEPGMLGGATVMSDEDEVNYSWVRACDAVIHFAQGFAAELGNTSNDGGLLDYSGSVLEASIEPLADPGSDDYVLPEKRMLVAVLVGDGIIVNYEIVGVTGNLNIPPYTRKYLLNARPDELATEAL
ncbi:hypothetical protein ACQKO6_17715 [Pseudomonas monteilii]